MKKLRISAEDLTVESFNTSDRDESAAGTVHANGATTLPCNISRGTCFQSCGMTNGYQYCILPYC